jgi:dolichyl-diphosphooligosaccharide--protein glycosyltransferase
VTGEIDELKLLPPRRTLETIVRNAFVSALGLAGFALLAGLHWRQAIPALPIVALVCLVLLRSYRYAMYLAPFAGIGLGYLLGVAIRRLARPAGAPALVGRGPSKRRAALVELLIYALAFALVASNLHLSAYHSKQRSWMPPDLLASLFDLRVVLPPGAAVWTSWSFGYAIADVARASIFDDAGEPDAVIAQLMSRSMVTDDPMELAEIVSFVANRGRRGLEGLLSQSTSYAELLEQVARAYEPVRGEVYLLFTERMIREYAHYHYKGNWDFAAREGTVDGYEVRRCQNALPDVMVCVKAGQPNAEIDLKLGLIAERFFARKILFIEDGKVAAEIDYPHEEGFFVQVIDARDDAPYSVLFLHEPAFRSNFNQMFVLGRFDPDLYTEVYSAVPTARAFRLNPVARPDSERTGP